MTTPVSFELAKLLREKGFDLECEYIRDLYNSGLAVKASRKEDWNFKKPLEDAYSAPTIAEVVMWLYEKNQIWIMVRRIEYKTLVRWDFYINGNYPKQGLMGYISPTEAYEAAIEHTLKNLI